ncbi:response regulator transcription factor [Paraburkholderia sp. BL10I2N1]|uniref:response regulator transcription factor n=1 Tax=Paraburkholderia sp. BL10I2N1 TaxID=1938796 RepID=UPI00105D3F39|nr:response regulator transcription factor [Paraburkholderia sp. BL10I2N1]TDN69424.1 LuxR family two component transcriptional regulator [Paraburkholderia sp. BL10I2N1]
MNSFTIRVVLADDHPVILEGVRHGLEKSCTISVIDAVKNSTALIATLDHHPCDVLVSDYVMPGGDYGDGLALFSLISQRYPNLKIVVLSMLESPAVVRSLLDMGIHCILSKADSVEHLTTAVHTAYSNGRYLSPRMATIAASIKPGVRGSAAGSPLTKRELEVVRFFVSGMSVTEIAALLHRSKKTISAQKTTAMVKLGIARDADLVRYGIESGLVSSTISPNNLTVVEGDKIAPQQFHQGILRLSGRW